MTATNDNGRPSGALASPAPRSHVVAGEPVVSVKKMQLSDGCTDYFVSIKVGNREVTPHVFREEYKAAYHVALYSWLLNGTDNPDLMAFDEGDWPAQATENHGWQPIETADLTSTETVWLGHTCGYMAPARFSQDRGVWVHRYTGCAIDWRPSHWQKIPSHPAKLEDQP